MSGMGLGLRSELGLSAVVFQLVVWFVYERSTFGVDYALSLIADKRLKQLLLLLLLLLWMLLIIFTTQFSAPSVNTHLCLVDVMILCVITRPPGVAKHYIDLSADRQDPWPVFKKIARLVGWLGSEPRLVDDRADVVPSLLGPTYNRKRLLFLRGICRSVRPSVCGLSLKMV